MSSLMSRKPILLIVVWTVGFPPSDPAGVILDSSNAQILLLTLTTFYTNTLELSAGSGPANKVLCEL